jgi:hypothetical protein
MKHTKVLVAILVIAWLAAASAGGDANPANPAWEKMKTLVGSWQGMMGGTTPVSVTYTLVSNGTSLMESLTAEHLSMITMFNPDGDTILATHYCAAGNQPRLRAKTTTDPKSLDFQFVDVTNNQSPKMEVMNRLLVTFQDADHFQQQWTPGRTART